MSEPAPPPTDPPPDQSRQPAAQLFLRALQVIASLAVLGLLALLVWRVINSAPSHLVDEVRAGTKPQAPEFRLPVIWARDQTWPQPLRRSLRDAKVDPRELRGYPVVVNFWASWCGPCKDEAPRFAASAREHAGKVVFLAIDVQDLESDARSFLERFATPYVSVRDGGGSTYDDYGLTGLPETYWIDARGRVVSHYAGEVSRGRLEARIRAATEGSQ